MKTENHKKARLTAMLALTPSGARNNAVPPSRIPMPLRLTGSSVSSVTMGTRIQ